MDIPVLLVTGSPDVVSAAAAVEYGAFQYLIKPVASEGLMTAIERAANYGRMARLKRDYERELKASSRSVIARAPMPFSIEPWPLWMAFQPIVRADNDLLDPQLYSVTVPLSGMARRVVLEILACS